MQQLHWTPTLRAAVAAALVLAGASASNAASQAPVAAEHGMVVSAQHLATKVGVDVLKRGGNAVDAAVAVGYALAVVYPAAGNLGGGGFMTVQLADGRKTFLDFREKAPLGATANMYLDKDGNVIKGLSTNGHLAVGVPGTPTARWPLVLRPLMTLPSLSRYMLAVAASGAFSRKSRKVLRPSASCTVMKPPPPRLPAAGYTTASA